MSEQVTVNVKTILPTIPFPPNAEREPIRTERLIIRPVSEDDLDAFHSLRNQPEVMRYTAAGRIAANKEETREILARYLPPNDLETYNNMICLASTGELIGIGGMSKRRHLSGWPEIGYLFKKEFWGHGYATEFLRGWLNLWWALPRSEVELDVDPQSVDGPGEAPELLTAIVEESNLRSRRVLEKAGFREYKQWTERDSREGCDGDVTLVGLALSSAGQRN
ncbi:acyl-CoA N-acyltransferase [Hypoxylon sp. FL0543]|nr:acyl-CoA N-acyltransferase [Hypoxylon sp. FL0543]